jgi:hypothetical protein
MTRGIGHTLGLRPQTTVTAVAMFALVVMLVWVLKIDSPTIAHRAFDLSTMLIKIQYFDVISITKQTNCSAKIVTCREMLDGNAPSLHTQHRAAPHTKNANPRSNRPDAQASTLTRIASHQSGRTLRF